MLKAKKVLVHMLQKEPIWTYSNKLIHTLHLIYTIQKIKRMTTLTFGQVYLHYICFRENHGEKLLNKFARKHQILSLATAILKVELSCDMFYHAILKEREAFTVTLIS